MRSTFSGSVFIGMLLLLLGIRCQNSDSNALEPSKISLVRQNSPRSLEYFEASEQALARGKYVIAATQLNQGILAFRIETGKLSGLHAARANRAIDTLTRLRKSLRRGEAVTVFDLHYAILAAMESEPYSSPSIPKRGSTRFVPVGGN